MGKLRVLIPVNGAYAGKLRVQRGSGRLDVEGVERVLSAPSARAIGLARQLGGSGAQLVAVHVDRGAGEDVLREALSHGLDDAILIEGTDGYEGDAAARAHLIADVVRNHGPFDAVIGPAWSEFGGFTGTLPALAGELDLPVVVGVTAIRTEGLTFRITYESLFGQYELRIPRPAVVVAGDVPAPHPTAWGVHDAWKRGIVRIQADVAALRKPTTQRLRVEQVQQERRNLETVDGATLVRRMRSRGLVPERRQANGHAAPAPAVAHAVTPPTTKKVGP